jgi:dUTP pyrophosphatase
VKLGPGAPEQTGFYLCARSSIGNTDLVQHNAPGVIDPDYRGKLVAQVRNLGGRPVTLEAGTALFQAVAPFEPRPPNVEVWMSGRHAEEFLGLRPFGTTERGAGGFGSTGRAGTLA